MSKILINNTASAVNISDVGQVVPASGQLTINPPDYLLYADSSDVVTLVGNGTLTVNDGSSNLSISDGIDLIKGIFPSAVNIEGSTDSTKIGNVGDRLKVDANISAGPIVPNQSVVSSIDFLVNGSNKSMDVNGSSTAVVFQLEVPVGQTWYITELRMFLADGEIKKRNEFGAINQLINGFLVEYEISSNDYQHSNSQNNVDLSLTFPSYQDNGNQNNNLAADKDSFYGRDDLQVPVCLQAGDKIKATVRDDLTGLDELVMSVQYYRTV